MRIRAALITAGSLLVLLGSAWALDTGHKESKPRPFRQYPGREYEDFPLPPDYQEKTEWQFARLMYPPAQGGFRGGGRRGFGGFRGFGGNWKEGGSSWTTDYPRADRHLSEALRRLTRVHVRSVEQPVDLDDDEDVYNYPWLYAVEVGHWELTDQQARKMREFLDRGGFFMCDDFHDVYEWEIFVTSMQKVFPDRHIVDLPKNEPIFHTIYDLDDKYQVPGAQYLRSGRTWEQNGFNPKWAGIYDDKGRVVVAICHNMDLGDSWEWADDPRYDEKFSAMGFRIAANYLVYSMTH
ncbi:MAG: DUF4159 domain-containing protein [Acidobacteriota bacterium]